MLKNRDTSRTNKANKAVRACLFGKLTNDTLNHIRTQNQNSISDATESMLQVAESTNLRMMDHFCKSSDSISKDTCITYANDQHNLIVAAMKNKEDVAKVKCISPYIVDEKLLECYQNLHDLSSSPGKHHDKIDIVIFSCYSFLTN